MAAIPTCCRVPTRRTGWQLSPPVLGSPLGGQGGSYPHLCQVPTRRTGGQYSLPIGHVSCRRHRCVVEMFVLIHPDFSCPACVPENKVSRPELKLPSFHQSHLSLFVCWSVNKDSAPRVAWCSLSYLRVCGKCSAEAPITQHESAWSRTAQTH